MKALFNNDDSIKVVHEINFENNRMIDFLFDEKELAPSNLEKTINDIVYVSAIPFIRYCQNAVNLDQAKLMKKLFLGMLDDVLENALKDDAPIGGLIKAKKEGELYEFMEELYEDWLCGIGFTTESLQYDFKDFTFVELKPTFDLWYTLSMVFENEKGNIRHLPLKMLYEYEGASNEDIKRSATFSLLIGVVILDKLGYDPNPLRKMNDLEAFEEEQLRIVKDYLNSEK